MNVLWNLRASGLLLTCLGLLHMAFPRRFRWSEEFRDVSLLSRQMFYVHTGFIALIVFLNGLLFLFLAPDLVVPGRLVSALLGGITLFWATRFFVQIFVYSPELWRGRKFETRIHIGALILWFYLTVTSGAALLQTLS